MNGVGLTEGTPDNIGGDGIGFVSNACGDSQKAGVVVKLQCYSKQIANIRKKRPKKVTRQKARDRNTQEEGLLKKIRELISSHPWLVQEYAHLIPDGAMRPS